MKNIKFLILILAMTAVTVSCESYDDYDTDRKPVVGFATKTKNINNIPSGGEKSTTVDVFASNVSSQDRTFNVVVVPITDTEATPPTDSANYSFEPTVTIPADERAGVITVTGKNVTLTSDRTFFRLAIESDPSVVAGGQVTIGLKGS